MSWPVLPLLAAPLAFSVTTTLASLMLRTGFMLGVVDRPNERSLHSRPTPRIGGIPLLIGALIGSGLVAGAPLSVPLMVALSGGVSVLAVVGALDDRFGLRARTRLCWQLAAAVLALACLQPVISQTPLASLAPWGLGVLSVLAITWSANLYNFMDGCDGLAGSMALWGFGAFACSAAMAEALDLAIVSAALAGSALGFLRFNWHPARVFMGDVGSVPLGFAACVIGLEGAGRGTWSVWTPLVAFWPFVFDASLTLARRLLRGAKIWEAHREHLYQKLVRMGWGHRRTARLESGVMALCGLLAVFLTHFTLAQGALILGALTLFSLACTLWVEARWKAFEACPPPPAPTGR